MTRKHFVLIANTINDLNFGLSHVQNAGLREKTARAFAAALGGTNPNFDKERFVAAATREN